MPTRVLVILIFACAAQAQTQSVSSPDSQLRLTFSLANGGQLTYDVTDRGKPVIARSNLGLDVQNQPPFGANLQIVTATPSRIGETYTVPAGKSNPVHNVCNVLKVDLREDSPGGRKLTVEARAYDDGVAFNFTPRRKGPPSSREGSATSTPAS